MHTRILYIFENKEDFKQTAKVLFDKFKINKEPKIDAEGNEDFGEDYGSKIFLKSNTNELMKDSSIFPKMVAYVYDILNVPIVADEIYIVTNDNLTGIKWKTDIKDLKLKAIERHLANTESAETLANFIIAQASDLATDMKDIFKLLNQFKSKFSTIVKDADTKITSLQNILEKQAHDEKAKEYVEFLTPKFKILILKKKKLESSIEYTNYFKILKKEYKIWLTNLIKELVLLKKKYSWINIHPIIDMFNNVEFKGFDNFWRGF